jgi:hypothetical protein
MVPGIEAGEDVVRVLADVVMRPQVERELHGSAIALAEQGFDVRFEARGLVGVRRVSTHRPPESPPSLPMKSPSSRMTFCLARILTRPSPPTWSFRCQNDDREIDGGVTFELLDD